MGKYFINIGFSLLFGGLLLQYIGCKEKEKMETKIEHSKVPVELNHIDKLATNSMKFQNGKSANYKVLLDKSEIVTLLFELKKGDEIPEHFHKVKKALYVYNGKVDVLVAGKMINTVKGDTLYVPENSITKIRNIESDIAEVFFFFPIGYFKDISFNVPEPSANIDKTGMEVKLIKEDSVPWENWDGKLPPGKMTPLTWRTIIDNESMVLGVTKIDPGHDVDSHYHKQTQIVIFSDGEGKTHIKDGEYNEIKTNNFIYPPTYSIHHSVNLSKVKPLMEVYFFPTGPFSNVKYLFKKN